MAFLKFAASIVLGGGLGYILLVITTPDESDLKQHLPPYSSEKHSLFKPSYKSSARFMNQERANGLKKFETQHSVNDIEK